MKNYTTPKFEIVKFNTENIITSSGNITSQTLEQKMENDGYTVTTVNIAEVQLSL